MSANVSGKPGLTGSRAKAAVLVAQDILSDTEIAAACGVTQRSIERWKRDSVFRERVLLETERLLAEIRAEGIANKQNRINAQNDRWIRINQMIAARADYFKDDALPHARYGLMDRTLKSVKHTYAADPQDPDAKETLMSEEVWEYQTDSGLLREARELEKHAAQEVGQWTEKKDVSHEGDVTIRVVYVDHND